jgi:lysine decarboxylase/arginine decarboxylase
VAFYLADPEVLSNDSKYWVLEPDASWHGFEGIDQDWCMLDPIKVSILTPGMSPDGKLAEIGIPANIVSAYLHNRGIKVEKTTDFTILVLFSLGITKGKWGSLASSLADFKRDYDKNISIEHAVPHLQEDFGDHYAGMGIRDLSDAMFQKFKDLNITANQADAFAQLPEARCSPAEAYEKLVLGETEMVTLDELAGRTLATCVAPCPPGIPLLVPGENVGPSDGPIYGYLKALESFDREFPVFAHEKHGIEVNQGAYNFRCIR